MSAEVVLKVVKPETAQNKEASIKLLVPKSDDIFSSKVADTFEEARRCGCRRFGKAVAENERKNES